MKILRITVSAEDVAQQKDKDFQKELTDRLESAGFYLEDPIIRQPRSDIYGAVDFIQLRYGFLDRFDILWQYFWRNFGKKIKRQFTE